MPLAATLLSLVTVAEGVPYMLWIALKCIKTIFLVKTETLHDAGSFTMNR